ncbi:hypothetical protein LIER_23359 [Lithospermum erythrorhizon]|uniref:Reverse transcriptase n=1 Tax=Lithospermum erythrorhizon TaxID=34254 RepID=A0AAV3QXE0_LITER
MSEIRPISLCNIVAKIVSKVLTNRLRPVLMKIISETQSAFLPSRIISDNIFISHEVLLERQEESGKETPCRRILREVEERKVLNGIRISRESPSISHILFADDTMIFCKAKVEEGIDVRRILGQYEVVSGQNVNINNVQSVFDRG